MQQHTIDYFNAEMAIIENAKNEKQWRAAVRNRDAILKKLDERQRWLVRCAAGKISNRLAIP